MRGKSISDEPAEQLCSHFGGSFLCSLPLKNQMGIFLIRDACTSPPEQVLWPSGFKTRKSGYGFSQSQCCTFPLNWKKKMWVEFNQLKHFRNGIPGHFPQDRMKYNLSLCTWPWFCTVLSQEGPPSLPSCRTYSEESRLLLSMPFWRKSDSGTFFLYKSL